MNKIKIIEWVLRISVAGEFVGHGVFALQGKKDWISWIHAFTKTDAVWSAKILLLVGLLDLAIAFIILVKPIPNILLWAVFWGFWTALVRPLVGLPIWDFIERWANWGAPLALYFILKLSEPLKD